MSTKMHVFRLRDGDDLRASIEKYVADREIRAGYLLTCVGGLSSAVLRMPGAKSFEKFNNSSEIVSVEGTLSVNGCHVHIAISDVNGDVKGGHLVEGCIVRLTSEIVIMEDTQHVFDREFDVSTGFKELKVTRDTSR